MPDHLKEGRKLLALGQHDLAHGRAQQGPRDRPLHGRSVLPARVRPRGPGRVRPALADFDHALRCDPQHAHAYLHRGRIRTEKGELDGALADFDQVMIMRPNDAECYLNRGVCLAKKGILSDAILDFQRVLKLTNHSDYCGARPVLPRSARRREPPGAPVPSTNGSAQPPVAPPPRRRRIMCSRADRQFRCPGTRSGELSLGERDGRAAMSRDPDFVVVPVTSAP